MLCWPCRLRSSPWWARPPDHPWSLPFVLSRVTGARRPPGAAVPASYSPSLYHSARGCTLFSSGVTSSVHLRVTVSPSLLKVTPNFSRNWTSKCMYGITDEGGTGQTRGRGYSGRGAGRRPRGRGASPGPHAPTPRESVFPRFTHQSPQPQGEGIRRLRLWKGMRFRRKSCPRAPFSVCGRRGEKVHPEEGLPHSAGAVGAESSPAARSRRRAPPRGMRRPARTCGPSSRHRAVTCTLSPVVRPKG